MEELKMFDYNHNMTEETKAKITENTARFKRINEAIANTSITNIEEPLRELLNNLVDEIKEDVGDINDIALAYLRAAGNMLLHNMSQTDPYYIIEEHTIHIFLFLAEKSINFQISRNVEVV